MDKGTGEGFKRYCWEGLQISMDVIAQTGITVIVNGGGLSPQNLAKRCQELINKNKYNITVAYVSGDNTTGRVRSSLKEHGKLPSSFQDGSGRITADEVLACTAYLGARATVKALEKSADIIICGRVADAAPIMGAAWW